MSLKVAFLSNKLTLRGSEVALYDYAHYNETLLGNESFIVTRDVDRIRHEFDVSLEAYERFAKRFGRLLFYESMTDIERHIQEQGIDVLYIIKSGEPHDGLITTKCRCVVHAVFNPTRPHGDRFAVIHEQLNKLFGTRVPVVPYIVALPSQEDL